MAPGYASWARARAPFDPSRGLPFRLARSQASFVDRPARWIVRLRALGHSGGGPGKSQLGAGGIAGVVEQWQTAGRFAAHQAVFGSQGVEHGTGDDGGGNSEGHDVADQRAGKRGDALRLQSLAPNGFLDEERADEHRRRLPGFGRGDPGDSPAGETKHQPGCRPRRRMFSLHWKPPKAGFSATGLAPAWSSAPTAAPCRTPFSAGRPRANFPA